MNLENLTTEKFDEILEDVVDGLSAGDLLRIGAVNAALREQFNNEVIQRYTQECWDKSLSEVEVQEYLKDPTKCPYCGSRNLSHSNPFGEFSQCAMDASCCDCDREWKIIFSPTNLIEE